MPEPRQLRIAYAGTPAFASTALQAICEAGWPVCLVLTQPDRPAGRGMKLQASPVKLLAQARGLPLAQPQSLRLDGRHAADAQAAQAAFQADDPLQGEQLIERERWAFIEALAVNRYFDMDYLVSYALLLEALERRARFNAEAGEAGYGTVYRSVLDSADYRDESGEQR